MTDNVYYVYLHRRNDTNEVFYVGKGKNYRYKSKDGRNKWWVAIVDKHGFTPEIVESGMCEENAFDLEIELIHFYKECGHSLCNLTDGGEGCSGTVRTTAHREAVSAAQLGKKKPPGQRRKMAAAKMKPVLCSNGMRFPSVNSAVDWCKSIGILKAVKGSISDCCRKYQKTAYGFCWEFDTRGFPSTYQMEPVEIDTFLAQAA